MDQNITLGRFLAGSSWVSDGIDSDKAFALETFEDISSSDFALGAALTNLEWLRNSSVLAQTKRFWLESFLDLAPYPNVATKVASLPWVIEGHTSDRRVAQRNLVLIAKNDVSFLEELLELPWLRDDISRDEVVAIQEIATLQPTTTQSLLDNAWFLDDLTLAESRLATITDVDPDLPPVLLGLEWTKDGISENDKLAIGLLALLNQPTARIVAAVPWFINAPVEDQKLTC